MNANYILMHKNTPVAYVSGGYHLKEIFLPNELPLGIYSNNVIAMERNFGAWLKHRTIPENRMFAECLKEMTGLDFPTLMLQSMSISLTDTYWLKPLDKELTWEEINYHDNLFSNNVANALLFNQPFDKAEIVPHPTFTTDGVLAKTWTLIEDIPYLVKYDETKEQLIGEVFASRVADLIPEIKHVSYRAMSIDGKDYCICPCLISDSNTDMIHAMMYQYAYGCTRAELYYKLHELDPSIDKMIAFDGLIGECDRHLWNFAFADNKLLPLYDNGRCLSYLTDTKPFTTDKKEQLSLMQSIPFELPQKALLQAILQEVCEDFKTKPSIAMMQCISRSYIALENIYEMIDKKGESYDYSDSYER